MTETFEQWWAVNRQHNESTRAGYARWAALQPASREVEIGRALFGPCIAWDQAARVWGAVAPSHREPSGFVRAAAEAADKWDAEHPPREPEAELPTREMIYLGQQWLTEQRQGRQLGVSARQLIRYATEPDFQPRLDSYPQDPSDLARAEETFSGAPEWARQRMAKLIESYRAHVAEKRASGRAWWRP